MKSIMQARHGVDNASNILGLRKESWKKAHETKKLNGTYKSSRIEREFYEALIAEGCNVDAQRVVLDRPIDITIVDPSSTEVLHVQVDGRYWHGLDRPIEELCTSVYPRDHSILARWHADRHQDEQFTEHGMLLVRITDNEAKEWLRNKQKLLPLLRQRVQLMKSTILQRHS